MKTIGFFGGSFDPIHLGHINLAIELFEKKGLDQILFCPALLSPTKQNMPPLASPEHRMNMLHISLQDLPFCKPYGRELERPPPSYTIDTIREMRGDKIFLILAEDVAYELDRWKDIEELLELSSPLVGTRFGFDIKKINRLPQNIKLKLQKGLCHISAMDINSTTIRERLKKKMYCSHLLQEKVLDYIYKNELYCAI